MKRLLSLGILVLAALTVGCATARVSDDRVQLIWHQVQSEYPDRQEPMPEVVWVDKDLYIQHDGRDVFVNGAYSTTSNTVFLREWWADEDTVRHEFRHAHGDVLGEDSGELVLGEVE